MIFTKTKAAFLQAKSGKILSTFTKTKEQLLQLNENLAQGVEKNEAKILELASENAQMKTLAKQHANIISNITNFLNA